MIGLLAKVQSTLLLKKKKKKKKKKRKKKIGKVLNMFNTKDKKFCK